ncbi:hypothetical protein WJX72_002747 [[Myrmecia] bisecta]|uniref:Uncharacterized protein n=1 Tax=[Myrmecia] bisecta TaxID=41462 RepID=A0AAW1PGU0_9CHLO
MGAYAHSRAGLHGQQDLPGQPLLQALTTSVNSAADRSKAKGAFAGSKASSITMRALQTIKAAQQTQVGPPGMGLSLDLRQDKINAAAAAALAKTTQPGDALLLEEVGLRVTQAKVTERQRPQSAQGRVSLDKSVSRSQSWSEGESGLLKSLARSERGHRQESCDREPGSRRSLSGRSSSPADGRPSSAPSGEILPGNSHVSLRSQWQHRTADDAEILYWPTRSAADSRDQQTRSYQRHEPAAPAVEVPVAAVLQRPLTPFTLGNQQAPAARVSTSGNPAGGQNAAAPVSRIIDAPHLGLSLQKLTVSSRAKEASANSRAIDAGLKRSQTAPASLLSQSMRDVVSKHLSDALKLLDDWFEHDLLAYAEQMCVAGYA